MSRDSYWAEWMWVSLGLEWGAAVGGVGVRLWGGAGVHWGWSGVRLWGGAGVHWGWDGVGLWVGLGCGCGWVGLTGVGLGCTSVSMGWGWGVAVGGWVSLGRGWGVHRSQRDSDGVRRRGTLVPERPGTRQAPSVNPLTPDRWACVFSTPVPRVFTSRGPSASQCAALRGLARCVQE